MQAELYWIEGSWPGKLAIAPRPRGGDWLPDEIQSWRNDGIDVVFSALTPDEELTLDLANESHECATQHLEFLNYPIPDREIPQNEALYAQTIETLATRLTQGKNVLVHCRQGVGRAGLTAISTLSFLGRDLDSAIAAVTHARGVQVPETPAQLRWAQRHAQNHDYANK